MKAVRIGICVLVAFAVLAFGTVEVWSESVLEIGAGILLLWWAGDFVLRRESRIYWPAICWPLVAFVGLVAGQLVFGESAYVFLTRVALMKILACFVLFFLAIQAFRTREDLKALAWFLMCFGFCVAVFGIAQNYTSHDVIYWSRPLTGGGNPFGPYVNRNDFAGFMELIIPVGLCMLAFRGVRREQQPFVAVLTVVPIVALILTASRGGIVSFACEIILIVLIARIRKARFGVLATSAILLVAVGVVGWLGAGKVLGRLESSNLHEIPANRRVSMLRGGWNIFRAYPVAGTGLGTLVAVYPKYETDYDGRIVDHVHNDYIELLAETGIAGGLCGLVFLGMLFYCARSRLAEEQSSFSQAVHAAGIVACFGLLVHGLVDFNFHIPANGLLFLLQASVVVSPALRRRERGPSASRVYTTSTIDIQSARKT